jgi:hypothetical protein
MLLIFHLMVVKLVHVIQKLLEKPLVVIIKVNVLNLPMILKVILHVLIFILQHVILINGVAVIMKVQIKVILSHGWKIF